MPCIAKKLNRKAQSSLEYLLIIAFALFVGISFFGYFLSITADVGSGEPVLGPTVKNLRCGNGYCSSNEDCSSCSIDCGICPPECGDSTCAADENSESCQQDCGMPSLCGNSICDAGESAESCPDDCTSLPVCGNSICEAGENIQNCQADCGSVPECGNGICNSGETSESCPSDCQLSEQTACALNQEIVSECLCNGQAYSSGYCCEEGYSATECLLPVPDCTIDGQISSECICDGNSYSSGYCCTSGYSETACAAGQLTAYAEPQGSSFSSTIAVVLSASDSNAVIYYTTDGSMPAISSSIYSPPLQFTSTTTLKFFAVKETLQSEIMAETYTKISANLQASIQVFKTSGLAPFTVLFNAKNSTGSIMRYDWDFSDSNPDYARYDKGRMAGHRFGNAGTYNVTLTVYDEAGASDTESIIIESLARPANARDYYISASGNDNSDGLGPSTPWRTIAKVNAMASALADGSRILFKSGESFDSNGDWSVKNLMRNGPYYITIGAYGSGENPIITFSSGDKLNTYPAAEGKGLVIEDLDIRGTLWVRPAYHTGTGFAVPGNHVTVRSSSMKHFSMWDSTGVSLENVRVYNQMASVGLGVTVQNGMSLLYLNKIEVKDAKSHCIYIAGGGNDILVENSELHHCGIYESLGGNPRDGFTVHGRLDNLILRNSDIHHNAFALGFDAAYVGDVEYLRNVIIENNRIHDQRDYGLQLSSQQNLIIRNNLIYNNAHENPRSDLILLNKPHNYGGVVDEDSDNVMIYNNVIYNNKGKAFSIASSQVHRVSKRREHN